MKKIITFILIAIMLVTLTATFVGCGDKDIADLKNQFDELNNKFDELENQYNDLENRVKKLETTMSLLDIVGESAQFIELKNKVTQLQKDLLSNSTNDTQIKSQVTQMQLILDKIYSSDSADKTILNEVQNQLNTLYGEVNRVLPFENGKEYEVKLNGVVYYTISILLEYHDGIVQSEQDIKDCVTSKKHFCGSIKIYNNMLNSLKADDMMNTMLHLFDNVRSNFSPMYTKDGYNLTKLNQIDSKMEGQWYFYITPSSEINSNYKIVFKLPNINLDILTLDNVWGDENGLMSPIIGTQS